MGEQEKFAKVEEVLNKPHLVIGISAIPMLSRDLAYDWAREVNDNYAQSLARFRERCKEAVKAHLCEEAKTPSALGFNSGIETAIEAIDEVPL